MHLNDNNSLGHFRSAAKKNLGFLLLLSMFVASLLLNVQLGLGIRKQTARHEPIAEGAKFKTIPLVATNGSPGHIELGGKPTLLYVMAPSCHWCARNLANIRTLAEKVGAQYRIIGLSNTTDGLADYVATTSIPFPIYAVDNDHRPKGLDTAMTPQLALLDENGMVKQIWVGALSGKNQASVEEYFKTKLPGLLSSATSNSGSGVTYNN